MNKNWPRKKVSELCDLIVDCVNKTAPVVSYPTEFKMIRTSNIKNGRIDLSNCRYVEENTYSKWTRRATLQKGDVLLTREAPMGEVGLVNFEDKAFLGQRVMQYRPNPKVLDSNYLLYSFLSSDLQSQFNRFNNGGSIVSHICVPDCFEFEISTPPLSTQQKIAKVLSDLDAKIELNNRINAELEAMAKLVYEYWFVQFDFPRCLSDVEGSGVEGYKSSGGKMVWNEELKRDVPEGWRSGYLSDLGKIIGGSTPSRENPDFFTTDGIPWITPKDLSNNIGNKFIFKGELDVTTKGRESASLTIMPRGTILMSSRAPIGYLAISVAEVTTNQGFKSFIPEKPFTTEFVYYKLTEMMPVIENNASGSTFKEVSGSTLKGIKIIIPSDEVIEAFSKKVSPFFEKQENLQKQNQELSTLRDWLLPMLMNGQVTVDRLSHRDKLGHLDGLSHHDGLGDLEEELRMVAEREREKYGEK